MPTKKKSTSVTNSKSKNTLLKNADKKTPKKELSKTTQPEVSKPKSASKKVTAVKSTSIAKKLKKEPEVVSDDTIDIEAFNLEHGYVSPAKTRDVQAEAVVTCPQGKQPKVIRDNCKLAPPQDKNQYIVLLHVKLSTQQLTVTWKDGKKDVWLCSPNPSLTPRLKDVVGFKCGAKHTNYKRDGMAWFTALKSKGMAYGFHNSQPVGIGIKSHGCIRVRCEHAKIINQNSWSGVTKIEIVR